MQGHGRLVRCAAVASGALALSPTPTWTGCPAPSPPLPTPRTARRRRAARMIHGGEGLAWAGDRDVRRGDMPGRGPAPAGGGGCQVTTPRPAAQACLDGEEQQALADVRRAHAPHLISQPARLRQSEGRRAGAGAACHPAWQPHPLGPRVTAPVGLSPSRMPGAAVAAHASAPVVSLNPISPPPPSSQTHQSCSTRGKATPVPASLNVTVAAVGTPSRGSARGRRAVNGELVPTRRPSAWPKPCRSGDATRRQSYSPGTHPLHTSIPSVHRGVMLVLRPWGTHSPPSPSLPTCCVATRQDDAALHRGPWSACIPKAESMLFRRCIQDAHGTILTGVRGASSPMRSKGFPWQFPLKETTLAHPSSGLGTPGSSPHIHCQHVCSPEGELIVRA